MTLISPNPLNVTIRIQQYKKTEVFVIQTVMLGITSE